MKDDTQDPSASCNLQHPDDTDYCTNHYQSKKQFDYIAYVRDPQSLKCHIAIHEHHVLLFSNSSYSASITAHSCKYSVVMNAIEASVPQIISQTDIYSSN